MKKDNFKMLYISIQHVLTIYKIKTTQSFDIWTYKPILGWQSKIWTHFLMTYSFCIQYTKEIEYFGHTILYKKYEVLQVIMRKFKKRIIRLQKIPGWRIFGIKAELFHSINSKSRLAYGSPISNSWKLYTKKKNRLTLLALV